MWTGVKVVHKKIGCGGAAERRVEESDAARRAGQPGWSRADGRRKWAPVDSMRYNVCSPSLDAMVRVVLVLSASPPASPEHTLNPQQRAKLQQHKIICICACCNLSRGFDIELGRANELEMGMCAMFGADGSCAFRALFSWRGHSAAERT